MNTDYFAAEQPIKDRLAAQVPDLVKVMALEDLAEISDRRQIQTPAAFVLFDGDRTATGSSDGRVVNITQRWAVVLAVRSARSQQGGDGQRTKAGPLISQIWKALAGFEPVPGMSPMKRTDGQPPVYLDGGFAYFSLSFETSGKINATA